MTQRAHLAVDSIFVPRSGELYRLQVPPYRELDSLIADIFKKALSIDVRVTRIPGNFWSVRCRGFKDRATCLKYNDQIFVLARDQALSVSIVSGAGFPILVRLTADRELQCCDALVQLQQQ